MKKLSPCSTASPAYVNPWVFDLSHSDGCKALDMFKALGIPAPHSLTSPSGQKITGLREWSQGLLSVVTYGSTHSFVLLVLIGFKIQTNKYTERETWMDWLMDRWTHTHIHTHTHTINQHGRILSSWFALTFCSQAVHWVKFLFLSWRMMQI